MGFLEPETGLVVVERLDPTPHCLAVTIVAFFSETALVRFFGLVTVEAAPWSGAEFCFLRVAATALHGPVGIPQRKVRKGVVKCFAVELDDVGISPFVIGVTTSAVLFGRICLAPVKPFTRRTIRANFLVACQT